jgi:hypothetical protein
MGVPFTVQRGAIRAATDAFAACLVGCTGECVTAFVNRVMDWLLRAQGSKINDENYRIQGWF